MFSVPRIVTVAATACALGAPGVAQASYSSSVMASSPLAYYPLNESSGTVAADATANDLDATLVNATLGAAAPFTGAGTAVALPSASAWIDGPSITTAKSVELWVKPTTNLRRQPLVIAGNPNNASGGWQVWISSSRKVWLTSGGVDAATRITLPKAAWSLLTVTWDGSKARFSVNGALRSTPAFTVATTGGALHIGSTSSDTFKGAVDEVALYDHVLTPAEIGSHYQSSSLPFATTAPYVTGIPQVGHDLTVTGAAWTGTPTTSRQWQRCDATSCNDIGGATGPTYTLTAPDVGDTIQVVETATNATGSVAVDSIDVGPVVAADQPTPPVIDPPPAVDPGSNPPSDPGSTPPADTTGTPPADTTSTPRADADTAPSVDPVSAPAGTETVLAHAANSCVASATPQRRGLRLRGIGRVTLTVRLGTSGLSPLAMSLRSPRGTVRSVAYRLDAGRPMRARRAPFSRSSGMLRPGVHRLRATVLPRHGKARVVTIRLTVKGC